MVHPVEMKKNKGDEEEMLHPVFPSSLWCQRRQWLRRREAINDLNNNAALCIPCHTLACLPLRGLSHTVSASTAYLPHAATPSCSCPPVPSLTLSNPSLSLHHSPYLTFSLSPVQTLLLTWCLHSWLIHCVPFSHCLSIPSSAPRGVDQQPSTVLIVFRR